MYTAEIVPLFTVAKADCLNGEGHDYKPQTTSPKSMTRMLCRDCGDSRNPTEEEKILYSIPSIEEDPALSFLKTNST